MTEEDRRHKEVLDAIQSLKDENEKYLPKEPYFDMLTPFVWAYKHPKVFWGFVSFILIETYADMLHVGVLSLLISLITKQ